MNLNISNDLIDLTENLIHVFETIIYEKQDNVAYVTLNRPKALNAYNIRMRDELYEVLGAIRDDPEVRVSAFLKAPEKKLSAPELI